VGAVRWGERIYKGRKPGFGREGMRVWFLSGV